MKNYPLNETRDFENVRELVEFIGEIYSEDIAYSYKIKPFDEDIQRVSYRRLSHDVRCLATELIARGLKGKHAAIIGKMSYGWACTYLAMLSVGVVAVPLDPDWTAEDLSDTVKKAECVTLFCGADTLANKADAIKEGSDISLTVLMDGDSVEDDLSHLIMNGYRRRNGGDTSYEDAEIDSDALALLVFTSGTTGKGKGVMLSQRALLSDIKGGLELIGVSKKTVSTLPPHHTFGSTITILGQLSLGVEIYISSGIKYIAKEIKEQQRA